MPTQKFIGYNDEILWSSNEDYDISRGMESKFKDASKSNYSNNSTTKSQNAELLLKSNITFGKYKGCTIDEVLTKDPKWLDWAIKNVDFFNVSEEVRELVADALFNY